MTYMPAIAKGDRDGESPASVPIDTPDAFNVRSAYEPTSIFSQGVSTTQATSFTMIALLGKKDVPTDGVEDYCRLLSAAMGAKGCRVEIVRVPWEDVGWIRAWMRLWQESKAWKGKWVLVQYTALMWSRRGLPLAYLGVLLTLKARGVRLMAIFHDFVPFAGTRWVDRIRLACQLWVFLRAYGWTRACVLPVPKEQVVWLPIPATKANFIPVGANIPAILVSDRSARDALGPRTIAIFGVTGGGVVGNEVSDIAFAAREAAKHVPQLKLVTLGRGSLESEARFRQALVGSVVEYSALGVLSAGEVARVLSSSDVSLFVRGRISTQRGSAIASIACLLPLVAYADVSLPPPLAEAGVVGVRYMDREALASAVVKVLTDDHLWLELRQRSRRAYERYFSWDAVSARFVELIDRA